MQSTLTTFEYNIHETRPSEILQQADSVLKNMNPQEKITH